MLLARDLGGGRARAHVLRRDASTTLDTLGLRIRVREVGGPPAEQATARGETRPVRR